jgi:hypothetical protein
MRAYRRRVDMAAVAKLSAQLVLHFPDDAVSDRAFEKCRHGFGRAVSPVAPIKRRSVSVSDEQKIFRHVGRAAPPAAFSLCARLGVSSSAAETRAARETRSRHATL